MSTTDLVLKDDSAVSALLGLVNKADLCNVGGEKIPVLKISTDPEAGHAPGTWVVGQRKDEKGAILDPGKAVAGLIILCVRNRLSYYNQKDTRKNCNSRFFIDFRDDDIIGSGLKRVCSKDCPNRDKNVEPHCKAQKVLFGVAITNEGQFIDCISYLGGSNYMPLSEYLEKAFIARTSSGRQQLPPFAFITRISSKREKNGGTTYYVGQWERGDMLDIANAQKMAERRDNALKYVDGINKSHASALINGDTAAPSYGARVSTGGVAPSAAKPVEHGMPTAGIASALETMDEMPPYGADTKAPMEAELLSATTATEMPSDDDLDIEAAIAKAIGAGK